MVKKTTAKKFLVAQLGARMSYAVPAALSQNDMLAALYTDNISPAWLTKLVKLVPKALVPTFIRRASGRSVPFVPVSRIRSFTLFGIAYYIRRKLAHTTVSQLRAFIWSGKKFCELVCGSGFDGASAFYGFNGASLEVMQTAKRAGMQTVLELTIAPRRTEKDLLSKEFESWPGWEDDPRHDSTQEELITREQCEWAVADRIVCGSTFVKNALVKMGVPKNRCTVVPYGISWNGPVKAPHVENRSSARLRLLTVGAVGLRKGAPWLHALAKAFEGKAEFRWVGPLDINATARLKMSSHVELTGAVPRQDIDHHYNWADALVLLSVCEGSATVIYEALSRGIPVICTENSGPPKLADKALQVVAARDTQGAQRAVQRLLALKQLGRLPRPSARTRQFVSYDAYERRLIAELRKV